MKIFTLDSTGIEMLRSLCGRNVEQVVWDINAVYFVDSIGALKVEADVQQPDSPTPCVNDELFCLKVEKLNESPRFDPQGEEGFFYRVVGAKERVLSIDLVRTSVRFPDECLAYPQDLETREGDGVNIVDCGLLVHLDKGILPAIQRDNSFGFHNWPEVRLHTQAEVEKILGPEYQLVHLCMLRA